jgi:hypothetical protein
MEQQHQPFRKEEVAAKLGAILGINRSPENYDLLTSALKETLDSNAVEKTTQAIKKAEALGFKIGVFVKLCSDPEIGKVVGYNKINDGFYPGDMYPVLVKFKRGIFEYGPNDLEITD